MPSARVGAFRARSAGEKSVDISASDLQARAISEAQVRPAIRKWRPDPPQSPMPGFGDNKSALSGLPSQSFASGGGSRFAVMFGQTTAYSALMASHFSSPGSVSALIASTGHSGSQTPQSMHSSGWIDEHILALVEAVHRAHLDTVH